MLDRDQTARKLYMTAADILGVQYHRQFIIGLQNELNNPEFIQAMKTTDWRTHIIAEVRENWHFLDELSRLLFWLSAMGIVKRENDA